MPQHRTSKSTPSATPIMSRLKAVEIIEIDDSEPGDCSHSGESIAWRLPSSVARDSKPTKLPGPIRPTSRRGPMSSITPATAQLDQCSTVSQRHEPQLIEIDSDEPPDEPPVRILFPFVRNQPKNRHSQNGSGLIAPETLRHQYRYRATMTVGRGTKVLIRILEMEGRHRRRRSAQYPNPKLSVAQQSSPAVSLRQGQMECGARSLFGLL
jgi:hypothetical protein